jgi:RNA polymerase sigma-70 factor (ECF subfamily)
MGDLESRLSRQGQPPVPPAPDVKGTEEGKGPTPSEEPEVVPASAEGTEVPPAPEIQLPIETPPGAAAAYAAVGDMELMERAKSGETAAFGPLFQRHADQIWRMAYMILHSSTAAEDVVQETFTRGLTHMASYRGEAEPRAWFSSIALNLCRHYLRDKNKEAELVDSVKLERGGRIRRPRTRGVLSSAVRRETNRMLAVALGFLTQAQREVFVLHYVEELPYEDVSQILEIRPGAARALAHRAKAALQKKLGPALQGIAKGQA